MFSKLRAPIQQIRNRIHPQHSTDKERTNRQDEDFHAIPLESDSPPPIPDKKKSCKCSNHRLKVATFIVEVLGVAGLFVYASLTYLMYCETKKAANAAKSAADTADATLRLAQRTAVLEVQKQQALDRAYAIQQHGAWIGTNYAAINYLGEGTQRQVTVQFQNFGFIDALEFNLTGKVDFLKHPPPPFDIAAEDLKQINYHAVLKPLDKAGPWQEKQEWLTVTDTPSLSDYKEYLSGARQLYIWGDGWYTDRKGASHPHVYFCRYFRNDLVKAHGLNYSLECPGFSFIPKE